MATGRLNKVERWCPFAPMGRPQALDAATFLIDQDRRLSANRVAKVRGQAADLIGALGIAGEQDKAERLEIAEESGLIRGQDGTGAAKDGGAPAHAHLCATGMQSVLSACKAAQKRRASSSPAKP